MVGHRFRRLDEYQNYWKWEQQFQELAEHLGFHSWTTKFDVLAECKRLTDYAKQCEAERNDAEKIATTEFSARRKLGAELQEAREEIESIKSYLQLEVEHRSLMAKLFLEKGGHTRSCEVYLMAMSGRACDDEEEKCTCGWVQDKELLAEEIKNGYDPYKKTGR